MPTGTLLAEITKGQFEMGIDKDSSNHLGFFAPVLLRLKDNDSVKLKIKPCVWFWANSIGFTILFFCVSFYTGRCYEKYIDPAKSYHQTFVDSLGTITESLKDEKAIQSNENNPGKST